MSDPYQQFTFEDPPPLPRGRDARLREQRIAAVLMQLRDHPGRWARVYTWPGATTAHKHRQRLATMHGYQFKVRRETYAPKAGGGSVLYARYVGQGD